MIDYARMQKRFPRQKAALTRAINSGDPAKVIATTCDTVREWDDIGCWPDDWARWNRALSDALDWRSEVDIDHLAGLVRAGHATDAIVRWVDA